MISVSAVIPCYNHGAFIEEAIASVLGQTVPVHEIIVVDDGSTDKQTIAVLKSLTNTQVKVYFNENKGVSAARNFGFEKAQSDYILTLDSDDYFAPTFLSKAIEKINLDRTTGAVSCWAQCFGESTELMRFKKPVLYDFLIKNQLVNAALIKKTAWQKAGGYDEAMRLGLEDWDFWIKLSKAGYDIEIIPEALFSYRIKNKSRNTGAIAMHEELYKEILKKHFEIVEKNYPEALLYIINYKDSLIGSYYNSINYQLGNKILFPFRKVKQLLKPLF